MLQPMCRFAEPPQFQKYHQNELNWAARAYPCILSMPPNNSAKRVDNQTHEKHIFKLHALQTKTNARQHQFTRNSKWANKSERKMQKGKINSCCSNIYVEKMTSTCKALWLLLPTLYSNRFVHLKPEHSRYVICCWLQTTSKTKSATKYSETARQQMITLTMLATYIRQQFRNDGH